MRFIFLAGVMGCLLCLGGIGHAIQRRWLQRGWLYTLGGVAALGVIASNACVFCDEPSDAQVYGFYALFGVRLIETVEVWFTDHAPYTPTAHRGPQLSPFLGYSREEDQHTVGLSIRW